MQDSNAESPIDTIAGVRLLRRLALLPGKLQAVEFRVDAVA